MSLYLVQIALEMGLLGGACIRDKQITNSAGQVPTGVGKDRKGVSVKDLMPLNRGVKVANMQDEIAGRGTLDAHMERDFLLLDMGHLGGSEGKDQ